MFYAAMLSAVKPKLHYYSLLDSVQFDKNVAPKTLLTRAVNVTGLLMLDVLVGNATPLLSQTQAFDNALLLAQLSEPSGDSRSFLRLVRKGHIQVRVAGSPSLLGAFCDALRTPEFVLSAWPELSDVRLRAEVLRCLGSATGDINALPSSSLVARLEGLRRFDDSLRHSPTMQWHAAMALRTQLSARIVLGLRELLSTDPASREGAAWLLTNAQSLSPTQQEQRSAWYRLLDELEGSTTRSGNTRGIIDGAYNSVVATSLGATGMFAQCPTEEVATALASVELNGVAGSQLVELVPDEHRYDWLSWEKVDSWLDESDHISEPTHRLDRLVEQGYVGPIQSNSRAGIALKVALPNPVAGLVTPETARETTEPHQGWLSAEGGVIGGRVSLLAALPVTERKRLPSGTENQAGTGKHWEYTVATGTASWQKSLLSGTVTAWSPRRLSRAWFGQRKPT